MFNLNIVYLIGEKTIEDVHFSMFNLNTVYLISEKTGLRMGQILEKDHTQSCLLYQ
jgi:hypothetical protein